MLRRPLPVRSLLAKLVVVAGATSGILGLSAQNPAGADTTTFSSSSIGQSGSTPTFAQSGPWTLAWSYSNCTGGSGNFIVTINNSSAHDVGPNELGSGTSGTDYYYDSGSTFNLSVSSECSWTITVSPSSASPLTNPTFTSTQTGSTGQTQQFSVASAWTMSWTYSNCSGGSGNFIVDINQPSGDTATDTAPNEQGSGGNGTDSYTDTGTFSLAISSDCQWSITIAGSSTDSSTTSTTSASTTTTSTTTTSTTVPPTTTTTIAPVVSASTTSPGTPTLATTGSGHGVPTLVVIGLSLLVVGTWGRRRVFSLVRRSRRDVNQP